MKAVPTMLGRQNERHHTGQKGWLRAAVLGSNDGIFSTASLVPGVAAADGSQSNVLVAGVAGLIAGAMSMAAGEYVSVHSQADIRLGRKSRRPRPESNRQPEKLPVSVLINKGNGLCIILIG